MLNKTGVAVGAGMQSIVAVVNFVSYYAVGIPLGLILTYVFHLGVKVTSLFLNLA